MSYSERLQDAFPKRECQNKDCTREINEADIIMKISPTVVKDLGEKAQAWTEDKQDKTEELITKVAIPALSLSSGFNEEINVEKTKKLLKELDEHFDLADAIKAAEIKKMVDKYKPQAEPLSKTEKQVCNQVDRVMLAINIHNNQFFSAETATLCKKCHNKLKREGNFVENIIISPFKIEVGRKKETTRLLYNPSKTPKVGENYARKNLISAIETDKDAFPNIAIEWYENQ